MKKFVARFNFPVFRKAIHQMGNKKGVFLFFILLFCAIEIVCTILSVTAIKGIFNSVVDKEFEDFWRYIGMLVLNHIIWWTYAPIATYITEKISKKIVLEYKTDLCEHILKLPQKILDTKPTGELISAITNDMGCLEGFYNGGVFNFLRSFIGGINGVIIMAVIDWRFAIVVLGLGLLNIWISSYFAKKIEKAGQRMQEFMAKISTNVYELISAAKPIRLLRLQKQKYEDFSQSAQKEVDIKIENSHTSARMNVGFNLLNMISYIAVIFAGAIFVYYDMSDWGTVTALISLKGTADMLFVESIQFLASIQGGVPGIKRVFELYDIPAEEYSESSYKQQENQFPLEMRNVSFSYQDDIKVLNHFDLHLKDKTLTVLLGESGTGKSTIMKLILGLYKPEQGEIIFRNDGENKKPIRMYTSYVPQDPFLSYGTISENILFGNPDATYDEMLAAAKMAGVDEFVPQMDNGYETLLIDYGKSLSGGQKQRISIARALVKDSSILLLDEITSALDKEMEEYVLGSVKRLSKSKAVLFITHRKDAVKWADEVIRLGED